MKSVKPTKKAEKPKKPKAKSKPKPIEPKWDKPEKLQHVPKTYLEGTIPEPKKRPIIKKVGMSNQELMDNVAKIHQVNEFEIKNKKLERIATFSIIGFTIILLLWLWSFSESKNEIKQMEAVQQNYQFQVDSLNRVIGDLQANLQTALDTIHNNSSKIPE